jgi:hypothetical protein
MTNTVESCYVDHKKVETYICACRNICYNQGCGFRDFVDPDPYWESGSGSRGKKTKKFQWKKYTLVILNKKISTESYKIALTTF